MLLAESMAEGMKGRVYKERTNSGSERYEVQPDSQDVSLV